MNELPNDLEIEMAPAKIGKNLTAQFCLSGGRVDCYWEPAVPRQPMPKRMRARYDTAQRDFMREVATHADGPVAMLGANGIEIIKPQTVTEQ